MIKSKLALLQLRSEFIFSFRTFSLICFVEKNFFFADFSTGFNFFLLKVTSHQDGGHDILVDYIHAIYLILLSLYVPKIAFFSLDGISITSRKVDSGNVVVHTLTFQSKRALKHYEYNVLPLEFFLPQ